jgi:hypothetical protein
VPALETFLRRVRFPGVPGAPAAAGVPVDRSTQLRNELDGVLTLLREADAAAGAVVTAAEGAAAERRARSADEARRVVADACTAAPAERSLAARTVLDDAARERGALLHDARRESDRIDRVAAERLSELTARVVSLLVAGEEDGS